MKKNDLFEKCVANVNPETQAEVERNIALTKEFWKEWRDADIPELIDIILWGMRKQKQIDFGKIDDCEGCDLCRKVYQEKFIEKACEWITENYDVYGADKSIIDGFTKAMEE